MILDTGCVAGQCPTLVYMYCCIVRDRFPVLVSMLYILLPDSASMCVSITMTISTVIQRVHDGGCKTLDEGS